jgi:hypothetical protein
MSSNLSRDVGVDNGHTVSQRLQRRNNQADPRDGRTHPKHNLDHHSSGSVLGW